jgi:hypothetical protein
MSRYDRRTAISVTMEQDRQSESCFHCGRCVREKLFPNISVVTDTGTHLHVQCNTHRGLLKSFELKEPIMKLDLRAMSIQCGFWTRENLHPNTAIGVTTTGTHLQVWCETHDISLGMFELKEPMAPMPCAICGKTKPHVH